MKQYMIELPDLGSCDDCAMLDRLRFSESEGVAMAVCRATPARNQLLIHGRPVYVDEEGKPIVAWVASGVIWEFDRPGCCPLKEVGLVPDE